MIGVDLNFNVDMSLYTTKNITNESDILQVKEKIGKLPKVISELLFNELSRTPLDEVNTELLAVNYVEPEDIEVGIDFLEF